MNDLTKDELETILDLFYHVESSPSWRQTEGWDDALKAKVQSMLNNYCEHVFYGESAFAQCHKCGEINRIVSR